MDYGLSKYELLKLRLRKKIEDELFMDQLDIECSCCYSEKPLDDFAQCERNHRICKPCIKTHAENMIFENSNYNIKCICSEEVCNSLYEESTLEQILDKKVFGQYLKLKIREETKYIFSMEGLNLIKCQFCETCWDADGNEKILYCRECGKSTCLECNQLEHKGTPCDKLRIKIEENLTKQKFLVCGSCSRCIFKEEGCNAIRCPCGNNMCWGCKKNWGPTDAHGCICVGIGTNYMAEFNDNNEAQAYINKLR